MSEHGQVELPPQEVVLQAIQGPLYGEALFLNHGVPLFSGQQLLAVIQYGLFFSQLPLCSTIPMPTTKASARNAESLYLGQ